MRLPRGLVAFAFVCIFVEFVVSAQASDFDWRWRKPLQPCDGDCAFMVFAGAAVGTNVQDIFFKAIGPTSWQYDSGGIVGATVSRRIARAFSVFDFELEGGAAKRLGNMDEGEFWGALYVRYTRFPWNNYVVTTFAMSTGLNYATGISDFERSVAELNPPGGTHILHYWSPELTFALPEHPERQLVVRLHHRSGAYGVISGAFSGATYLTLGIRSWF